MVAACRTGVFREMLSGSDIAAAHYSSVADALPVNQPEAVA